VILVFYPLARVSTGSEGLSGRTTRGPAADEDSEREERALPGCAPHPPQEIPGLGGEKSVPHSVLEATDVDSRELPRLDLIAVDDRTEQVDVLMHVMREVGKAI
jgi:hypothetical protein